MRGEGAFCSCRERTWPGPGHYVDILKGDQFDPSYLKLNAKAVVPTLVHDGVVVPESSVICEYLDEVFPARPLAPRRRARTRENAAVDQGRR